MVDWELVFKIILSISGGGSAVSLFRFLMKWLEFEYKAREQIRQLDATERDALRKAAEVEDATIIQKYEALIHGHQQEIARLNTETRDAMEFRSNMARAAYDLRIELERKIEKCEDERRADRENYTSLLETEQGTRRALQMRVDALDRQLQRLQGPNAE